jgi:hypothetical protein
MNHAARTNPQFEQQIEFSTTAYPKAKQRYTVAVMRITSPTPSHHLQCFSLELYMNTHVFKERSRGFTVCLFKVLFPFVGIKSYRKPHK